MRIVVELYGLPRRRAGITEVPIDLDLQSVQLKELIEVLAEQFPDLHPDCLVCSPLGNWELSRHIVGNRNGDCFIRSGVEVLVDGDRLLLMSADVGG